MSDLSLTLTNALFVNFAIAFGIFFYWHGKVIFTIMGVSAFKLGFASWNFSNTQNSFQNNFIRFTAGLIFPELRRKWLMAISYVAISFAALFLVAVLG